MVNGKRNINSPNASMLPEKRANPKARWRRRLIEIHRLKSKRAFGGENSQVNSYHIHQHYNKVFAWLDETYHTVAGWYRRLSAAIRFTPDRPIQ